MTIRLTRAIVLTTCAVALTACTESGTPVPSGNPGASTPRSTETTTAPSEDDRYGAPKVENPLDPAKQLAEPCTSLTIDQLRSLDMMETPRKGSNTGRDPSCAWRDSANRVNFTVTYLLGNENGLADLYRGQEQGRWKYWEPTTVNGYPGVWQEGIDLRDDGGCNISVGITDQLHIMVFSIGGEPSTACDQVKEIAGAVIDTLKTNGG